MDKALIFGITGQDGSYLTEILLKSGYKVYGVVRKSATGNTKNIEHLLKSDFIKSEQLVIVRGDLLDHSSIFKIISTIEPKYIYNEADQDHAGISFKIPAYNFDITGAAVGRNLEIIRNIDKNIK